MNRNKKIDDLFREKVPLKEEAPPNEVWEQIDARLTQNRKKKSLIIPLWYKIAGVAAILILIFTFTQKIDQPNVDSPSITNKPVEINGSKSDILSEEEVLDGAESSQGRSSEIANTDVTEIDEQAEENTSKPLSPTTFSQSTKSIRQPTESLQIVIKKENLTAYIFQISTDKIDFPMPENEVGVLEVKYENEAEDPTKKVVQEESFEDKFSLSPTIAAVYFGKIGEGNALDNKFAGNSNPGGITVAYGLSLAYQLSEKIKIRSGVNSLNLNSKTKNVENNLAGNASAVEGNPAGNIHYSAGYGTLDQQLDFIEIPLELEYSLIDKQVGVSLIAGASTFFLQENEVTLSTAGFTGSLGPANNLNNTSFSANLGIGLRYRLFSQIELKLNPIFKYQLNTYENVSDLKPYYLGIFSGVRFKF